MRVNGGPNVSGRPSSLYQRTSKSPAGTDVLDWLTKDGKGYQFRLNAILRRELFASLDSQAR